MMTKIALLLTKLLEDFLFVEFYESAVPKDLWRLVILTAPLEVWVFYFRPTLKALNKIKDYNLYLERAPTIFRFVVTLILMFGLELEVEAYIYTDIVAKLFMIITIFVCLVKDDVLGLSLKKTELKEMLHYGLRSYGTIVARSITSRIDHIIMALYLSPQYVGIYSIAQSLSEKLMMPTNAICLPLLPKFSRLNRADAKTFANKILDQLALPNLVVIVGASIATGFLIVLVYGEAYAEAHFPFVLLAMAVPPKSSSLILATFFNGTGRPEIKSLQRLGGLGLRALGLVSLVPVYGMAGCALATLGSELIVFSVNYWYYRKTEKLGSERIFHFRVSAITQELRRLKKFGPETKTPSN